MDLLGLSCAKLTSAFLQLGCFIMIDKKSKVTAWARKIPVRWNRWYFLHWTYTFWYLSSQKYQRQSVNIHILRLLRCIMVKIWKMHWKLKCSESQYCFANISRMKAWNFVKFFYGDQLLSCELRFLISWWSINKCACMSRQSSHSW